MEGIRNIKSLTMDELTGTINEYPWFGAARRELCERMSKVGGSEWGREQYAEAAMYIASRTIISDIVRSTRKEDYSDKDVETLLKKYIAPVVRQAHQPEPAPAVPEPVERSVMTGERSVMTGQTGHLPRVPEPVERPKAYRRTVRAAGGDFFSSEQYNEVKREDDDFFSRFKAGRSE